LTVALSARRFTPSGVNLLRYADLNPAGLTGKIKLGHADPALAPVGHALVVVSADRTIAATGLGRRRAGDVVGAVGGGAAQPALGVLEAAPAVALTRQALSVSRTGRPWPGRNTHTWAAGGAAAVSALALITTGTRRGCAVRNDADPVVAKTRCALRVVSAGANPGSTHRTRADPTDTDARIDAG